MSSIGTEFLQFHTMSRVPYDKLFDKNKERWRITGITENLSFSYFNMYQHEAR